MALQLRSLVRSNGELELSLHDEAIPEPQAHEVLIRIEASPMNPSDLGLLFGAADMSGAKASGDAADRPVVTAPCPKARHACHGRPARPVHAGRQRRRGRGGRRPARRRPRRRCSARRWPLIGGAMYSQYRLRSPAAMPDAAGRRHAAPKVPRHSSTRSRAGHGRDHAARRPQGAGAHGGRLQPRPDAEPHLHEGRCRAGEHRAQARAGALLKAWARSTCATQFAHFLQDLTEALAATGATHCLRRHRRRQARRARSWVAWKRRSTAPPRNTAATARPRTSRSTSTAAWTCGPRSSTATSAWLGHGRVAAVCVLAEAGVEGTQRLRARVVAELKTTFASKYTREVSLLEALQLDAIGVYSKQATGEKFLLNPNKGIAG
jgi:NADPH2:quinone reductase